MKVWVLQNQMRTEKQMWAAALRRRIFFFFFSLNSSPFQEKSGKIGLLFTLSLQIQSYLKSYFQKKSWSGGKIWRQNCTKSLFRGVFPLKWQIFIRVYFGNIWSRMCTHYKLECLPPICSSQQASLYMYTFYLLYTLSQYHDMYMMSFVYFIYSSHVTPRGGTQLYFR